MEKSNIHRWMIAGMLLTTNPALADSEDSEQILVNCNRGDSLAEASLTPTLVTHSWYEVPATKA